MNIRSVNVKFGVQTQLQGQVLLPQTSRPVPGAILCHGLGSGQGALKPIGLNLARHGIISLTFGLRGHGKSGGIFDGGEVEDVVAAWQYLSQLDGIDKKRIVLIGHSLGARATILAASKLISPYAIVALSLPPDMGDKKGQEISLRVENWMKGASVMEYPKQGALPWLPGIYGVISRAWMYLRGYQLRVDWRRAFGTMPDVKVSAALQNLSGRPKLFVHCRGDRQIPYQDAMELYEKAPQPKELILAEGGYHSTPLAHGSLREKWISWVVNVLAAGN